MSLILIISIAIRLVAMGWSIVLFRSIRDWRIGLMTAMFGLMALRQVLTLLKAKESWAISATAQPIELPGLAVSILAFLVVVFLGRLIRQEVETREALRKSEEHPRNILDSLLILVGLMTPNGTLIEANKTALGVAGLKPEDVLGKPFEETYWWSYSEPIKQQLREAIRRAAKGKTVRYDVVVRVGEDRFITIDFCLQPLFDEAGRVTYLVSSATDITERVRLEAEAVELIKVEKAISRVLGEGLRSIDLTGAGQACLEVAMEITSSAFGFVGELNEQGRFDTIAMADPGWEACRMPRDQAVVLISDMEVRGVWGEVIKHNRALITNDPSSHPASAGTPEGHPPLWCFLGVPLSRGEEAFGAICVANKPGGYTKKDRESLERLSVAFLMALDRSRAEKALQESEKFFSGTLNDMLSFVAVLEPDGKVIFVNNTPLDVAGITLDDVKGRMFYDAFWWQYSEEARQQIKEDIESCASGRTLAHEIEIQTAGGGLIWIEYSMHPIYDEDGKIKYLVPEGRNITDRKRAEEELKKYREHLEELVKNRTSELEERARELEQTNIKLKELDRLKLEFLATMSHELRTPLNSIIGFTGIILQGIAGEINKEQRKQLSMVYDSAKHLLSLINDILDLSGIESGKMEVSAERFKIQDIVSEVAQSLSPMISQKGLRLITEVPGGTPEIYNDRKKVFQILLNLVGNAVKFTETGEVRIECKFDSDNLEVSVSDTGIGIRKENIDYLFEAFRQVDGTVQRRYEGTGLGLYLCKKLVTLLGGRIWAESEYGKGSSFTFTLSLKPEKGEQHEKKDIGSRG